MGICRNITYNLVNEKDSKQKEIQKIMGLSSRDYIIGWLIYNFIQLLIVGSLFIIPFILTESYQTNY